MTAGTNRTTFRPTSTDQHVGPFCFVQEHVGEGRNEGEMLSNIEFELECFLTIIKCQNRRISNVFL